MTTNVLTKAKENFPALFDDFFKPWNEWFDGGGLLERTLTVPAVNISEEKDNYKVTMAAPGMKKDDFKVDVEGNLMTISAEQEEEKEEKDKKYNRKEYNYTSFSRSFTLPDAVNKDNIDAKYDNGILTLTLPKKDEAKKQSGKNIVVN
ncbi:MAG: Hsp20/alpha crystallin family protein [Bacteroidetes bacterium]|nr:Hsp20/alpha crystallin family protein [Bacteroidota bacterium]